MNTETLKRPGLRSKGMAATKPTRASRKIDFIALFLDKTGLRKTKRLEVMSQIFNPMHRLFSFFPHTKSTTSIDSVESASLLFIHVNKKSDWNVYEYFEQHLRSNKANICLKVAPKLRGNASENETVRYNR
ncbi:hypothetical protein HUJ05_000897 [Dendroctonus ponderosae]|nr:hypothetical protein HUJ05_000897 [Dendroctonus ponderosae]